MSNLLPFDPSIFLTEGLTPKFYGNYESPKLGGVVGGADEGPYQFRGGYKLDQGSSATEPSGGVPVGSYIYDWAGLTEAGVPPDDTYDIPSIGEIWASAKDVSGIPTNTPITNQGGFAELTNGSLFRLLVGLINAVDGLVNPYNLLFQLSGAPSYNSSLDAWKLPVKALSGSVLLNQLGMDPDVPFVFGDPFLPFWPEPIGFPGPQPEPMVYLGYTLRPAAWYGFDYNPNSGGDGGEDPGAGGGDPGEGGDDQEDLITTTIQSPDDAVTSTFDVPRGRSSQALYMKLLDEMQSDPSVMGNSPHAEYKEILRFLIARFSGLKYLNEEQKVISVKCTHARPERAIAKLNQQQNIILPTTTVAQTSIEEADNRRRVKPMLIHEVYWDEIKQRAERIIRFVDRPVNLIYTLNIWAKYLEDMDQLAEQVRLIFNPTLAVETPYALHTPAFIVNESDNSSMVLADREDRIVRRAFTIRVETYIKNPRFKITSTGEIQRFNIESPIVDC